MAMRRCQLRGDLARIVPAVCSCPYPSPLGCVAARPSRRQSSFTPIHASQGAGTAAMPLLDRQSPSSDGGESPALSLLPLTSVVRSFAVTSVSASPILLSPSLSIMSRLAHATSPLANPDRNPLLRWLLKRTFYAQFCAGENAREVRQTVQQLKEMGYRGVILGYAKEVVMDKAQAEKLDVAESEEMAKKTAQEVEAWKQGTLQTVAFAAEDDYVALKFTGAGCQALRHLKHNLPPSKQLESAIVEICDAASARNVRLLFDAEQQAIQGGVNTWTMYFMRKYNNRIPGEATIYGTYQAYLKATPTTLGRHLREAQEHGFTLGVKLVRGAYLSSDPRHLIHDTKADTDAAYNGIMESLIRRSYNHTLAAPVGQKDISYPPVNLVVASHNAVSLQKAQDIRKAQGADGPKINMVYAQLMGMADELSCELLKAGRQARGKKHLEVPRAYKYLVWGTTGECMKYLLRRAEENREAVGRTREGRDALAAELWRRVRKAVGLAA